MHFHDFAALLVLPLLVAASIIPSVKKTPVHIKDADDHKRDIPDSLSFNGIDWDGVLNETICNENQRSILLQTARNVWSYYSHNPSTTPNEQDPIWERYFGGRKVGEIPQPTYSWFSDIPRDLKGRQWNAELAGMYQHIVLAQDAAKRYPYEGNSVDRKQNRRVRFLCQAGERVPNHCLNGGGGNGGNIPAYTTIPEPGWPSESSASPYTITFCDSFFNLTYLERITADPPTSDLFPTYVTTTPDLRKLVSFEHVMYHEYMHVNWFGAPKRIVDMVDALKVGDYFDVNIYGQQACSAYARTYYPTNGSVNPMVGLNADNFAWYQTNLHIRNVWGADKDPFNYLDSDDYPHLSNPSRKKRSQDISVSPHRRQSAEEVQELTTWPRNCVWAADTDSIKCDDILDDYDDWVSESLGTTLSPECQVPDPDSPLTNLYPINPACSCHDNASGAFRLLNSDICRGFVGNLIGCRESGMGGCSCYTNLNDGPHYVDKKATGVTDCASLSVGLTNDDIINL